MGAVADTVELGKVTSKGQITIPVSIRHFLGVDAGDKIMFTQNGDGTVTMRNASLAAFAAAKDAFRGAAAEAGLESDDDVVAMIREMRAEGVER